MSEQPEELDFEERRKRLELLFAADPHLSPTMRARQIYDEPETQPNGNHASSNGTQPSPVGSNGTGDSAEASHDVTQSAPQMPRDPEAVRPDGMMSLTLARQEIRKRAMPLTAEETESGGREPDGLDDLRETVLIRWRRDIFSEH